MRVLTKEDFDIVGCRYEFNIIYNYMSLVVKKARFVEIRSDFAGNLFYNDGKSTKPLHICILELKNGHDNMNETSDPNKFYCQNPDCNNEIPEPQTCCSGHECGCMGQPVDPPVCSNDCMYIVYPHLKPKNKEEKS